MRVGFDSGSAKLGPQASQQLKRIAEGMSKDEQLRLQLLAYAGGTSETASQARRLSLSRALAARSYLIGEGVRSTRIDVRALGNKSEGGPPDRIDIIITKR
ncbi:MAG: OmpA family protein [Alphaproteobacteria bacterium]|nr:OmpA family protein [Alphaproteobacteria bacterium]